MSDEPSPPPPPSLRLKPRLRPPEDGQAGLKPPPPEPGANVASASVPPKPDAPEKPVILSEPLPPRPAGPLGGTESAAPIGFKTAPAPPPSAPVLFSESAA